MSNGYIVVDDSDYAPESIITTWDDLVEECEERGMDASSLHTTPMTIQEYTERTGSALQQNHPRNYPAYADDPVGCWRYVCRCYGAGLAPYSDKEIQVVITTLYGRWFIALDMSSRRPKIDNKEFVGWILDACREIRAS